MKHYSNEHSEKGQDIYIKQGHQTSGPLGAQHSTECRIYSLPHANPSNSTHIVISNSLKEMAC